MLKEISMNKALDAFLKGRKVVVVNVYDDGSINAEKLEDVLPKEGAHYLVDVPAVENPDFSRAIADMVHGSDQKPEEPAGRESNTPPPTGPEVSDPLPAGTGKTKKETALELAAQGMNAGQIARQIGAKYSTVYHWLNPEKCRPKSKKQEIPVDYKNPDAKPGWNADREKCKTCRYRQRKRNEITGGCDYISIAGHSRGCAAENCDRYVKGDRMEQKKGWVDE